MRLFIILPYSLFFISKVGEELTSGRPDLKEGIYFGSELDSTEVKPLHGPNLWPHTGKALSASTFEFSREDAEFKSLVLEYIDEMTALGHDLMRGVAIGLGLRPSFFRETIMKDPLILFRIFNYPDVSPWIKKYADQEAELRRKLFVAAAEKNSSAVQEIERQIQSFKLPEWSVGEHTDYGVLTLLKQDQSGGLQVLQIYSIFSSPFCMNLNGCFQSNVAILPWYRPLTAGAAARRRVDRRPSAAQYICRQHW